MYEQKLCNKTLQFKNTKRPKNVIFRPFQNLLLPVPTDSIIYTELTNSLFFTFTKLSLKNIHKTNFLKSVKAK